MMKANTLKALNAMNDLGIPPEIVKPVLQDLLKLYDRSWEFIEAENYRVLADAIFEFKEDKGVEINWESTMDGKRSEPSSKKFRGQEEDEVSSETDSTNIMIAHKDGDIFPASFAAGADAGTAEPSQSHPRDKRAKFGSQAPKKLLMDKEKDHIASVVKPISERASSSTCIKLPAGKFGSSHLEIENFTKQNNDNCGAGSSYSPMSCKNPLLGTCIVSIQLMRLIHKIQKSKVCLSLRVVYMERPSCSPV